MMGVRIALIKPPVNSEELLGNLARGLASDPGPDLSAVERLAILETRNLTRFISQRWWVDLLIRVGCYADAERITTA